MQPKEREGESMLRYALRIEGYEMPLIRKDWREYMLDPKPRVRLIQARQPQELPKAA
jgi:hypothetical protein